MQNETLSGIQVSLQKSFVHVTDPNPYFIKWEIALCSLCCQFPYTLCSFWTLLMVWSFNCEGQSISFVCNLPACL